VKESGGSVTGSHG